MKSEIEALEKNLAELKRKHEQQERIDYENSTHKSFLEGDIVKKGDQVGIVGWTENKAIKLPERSWLMIPITQITTRLKQNLPDWK
jgi:hypothetical protein